MKIHSVRVDVLNVLGAGDALCQDCCDTERCFTSLPLCKRLRRVSGIAPRLCPRHANQKELDDYLRANNPSPGCTKTRG
ncbi:hypothetical protein KCP75_23535 [Salmonella enterica subsp. enterica]|nr:hypothetical protein KCP75_23535 [Salmonella enterica subsp. enterica]